MRPAVVDRSEDERLYQPQIHSRWIRALHRISVARGTPMTVLVDHAIREYVETAYNSETSEGPRE